MIVLSWNCRGLARPKGKRNLRAIVRDICPGILFLMELKISFEKVKPCLHAMGFYNASFVDPVGKKGGIFLCRKNGVDLEITLVTQNIINAIIFFESYE